MSSPWNAQWIGFSHDPHEDLGVFAFRHSLELHDIPKEAPLRISADQRYKLFVNGELVGFGPQRGDIEHWFYDSYDLAPRLKQGSNEILALLWNFGWSAPMAQITARTGLLLDGPSLSTPGDWEVARVTAWDFKVMHESVGPYYIDIGPGEIISADWNHNLEWKKPVVIAGATERGVLTGGTPWNLIPRSIPPMLYEKRRKGPVVRHGFIGDSGAVQELRFPLNLKAGENVLLDYGELICAYPRLVLSSPSPAQNLSAREEGRGLGGEVNSALTLTYAEALWQDKGLKGNRDVVDKKKMQGYKDVLRPNATPSSFEPLWWRTYRYLLLEANADITIESIDAFETGYRYEINSSFEADDPSVKPIWDVSVRTAKRCAGETYFDCPYYEQLQYAGDTRIQTLIGYYLSPDRHLQRAALNSFKWSFMDNGLTQSRYPTRQPQVIPPFSLWYLAMLSDQVMYDREYGAHQDLALETELVEKAFDQLELNPDKSFWNFADWVPNWHMGVPPGGVASTVHALTRFYAQLLSYKAQREQLTSREVEFTSIGNELEQARLDLAEHFNKIDGLVREHNETPSEHAEALYRLCQIELELKPDPWPTDLLNKERAARCTYYFSYYKHHAMHPIDYMAELQPWKEMIEEGLSTFAENPDPVRSDCHAWSAHPILGFFQLIAGVTSSSAGWRSCRIAPNPGSLKRFRANIAHPDGNLTVTYENGRLSIDSPVPYRLEWQGKKQTFDPGAIHI